MRWDAVVEKGLERDEGHLNSFWELVFNGPLEPWVAVRDGLQVGDRLLPQLEIGKNAAAGDYRQY